ncbi:hypothetical protein BDZ89DRAFT_1158423 [Hymenopellis radicata]|nr:hypothetical protein BDZ89DRAFT_1158423 [Hymenopellis radicata]
MKALSEILSSYDWVTSYSMDRTLETVVSHNDEPTSLQLASIASSKDFIDLEHRRITQDLGNLNTAWKVLYARRRALSDISVQHAGALSILRRLPNEILVKIFLLWALEDEESVSKVGKHRRGMSPNTSIVVGRDDVRRAAFAQALQFCGPRHIHMKLSLIDKEWRNINESFGQLLDTIISSSPTWETLVVESNGELIRAILELFPPLERRLPLLRSLKLWGSQSLRGISSLSSPTLSTLLSAPLLDTVHIDIPSPVHITLLLNLVPLPCQQILQLTCYSHSAYDLALWKGQLSLSKEKFPLLEHCVLISMDPESASSSNRVSTSGRVEHDGVIHLVTSQADVLDTFSFPSLRMLSIGTEEKHGVFDSYTSGMLCKRVSDMLLASRCSLMTLKLSHGIVLVDEFLQFLHNVPTLKVLDMRVRWSKGAARDDVLARFFRAFGTRTNASMFSLLPTLQELRLSIAGAVTRTEEDYFDIWEKPVQPHNFSFVSPVFEAITERSRYPSDLRVFSFTMFPSDLSTWCLADGDIARLKDLNLTEFRFERRRYGT